MLLDNQKQALSALLETLETGEQFAEAVTLIATLAYEDQARLMPIVTERIKLLGPKMSTPIMEEETPSKDGPVISRRPLKDCETPY